MLHPWWAEKHNTLNLLATTAEDHIWLTIVRQQQESETTVWKNKTSFALMNLNFCCIMQVAESEMGINDMNPWTQPVLSTVQECFQSSSHLNLTMGSQWPPQSLDLNPVEHLRLFWEQRTVLRIISMFFLINCWWGNFRKIYNT